MTPEEQLLDELLDESKPGSINQTIKVFPDASRIDETKTSGRQHRTLLASIITRMKAWVVVLIAGKSDTGHGHTMGEVDNLQTTLNSHNQRITDNANALGAKADLVNGKVPVEQLPEMGTTINSTDDIQTEGAVNKWFTDARVYLAKASNYVIQGTTRAITQSDTLGMILGIFEHRLNTNTSAISSNTTAITGKVDKPVDRNIASTGSVTLTMDRDAFVTMTGGQITGNLAINLSGGVKGSYQVLTFDADGVSTVTINGASQEGAKPYGNTLGQSNKLWLRVGQNKSGTLAYFFQWV